MANNATRQEVLRAAVRDFLAVHQRYVDDPLAGTVPPLYYWEGAEALFATWAEGEIPADCRELGRRVDDFAREVSAHDEGEEAEPRGALWQAREALERAFQAPSRRRTHRPEHTVQQLMAMPGMTVEQVARMWGLWDEQRRPLTHLVVQEVAQPGSVIGPDYVHPLDREAEDRDKSIRLEHLRQFAVQPPASTKAPAAPCRETPAELYRMEGMTAEQAAKMLQRPVEEVQELWRQYAAKDVPQAAHAATQPPAAQPTTPPAQPADDDSDDIAELRRRCDAAGIGYAPNASRQQLRYKLQASTVRI